MTTRFLVEKLEEISIDEGEPDYLETVLNRKDLSDIHPLFLSVFSGNLEITKYLLEQGSDPMLASDKNGVTLLHICAERGYEQLTNVICKAAPKLIFECDVEGNTAMHVVCDWDYLDILKALCDTMDSQLQLANVESAALVDSDEDETKEESKPLKPTLNNKSQKKLKSPLKMKNQEGLTPIELAFEENTQIAYSYLCTRYGLSRKCIMCTIF